MDNQMELVKNWLIKSQNDLLAATKLSKLEILEQAIERSRQENQSTVTAWLMKQF